MAAAEGSEIRPGVSGAAARRSQSEVLLIGGSRTEAFDLYLYCVLYFVLLWTTGTDTHLNFGLSAGKNSYPFLQLSYYWLFFISYVYLIDFL